MRDVNISRLSRY